MFGSPVSATDQDSAVDLELVLGRSIVAAPAPLSDGLNAENEFHYMYLWQ